MYGTQYASSCISLIKRWHPWIILDLSDPPLCGPSWRKLSVQNSSPQTHTGAPLDTTGCGFFSFHFPDPSYSAFTRSREHFALQTSFIPVASGDNNCPQKSCFFKTREKAGTRFFFDPPNRWAFLGVSFWAIFFPQPFGFEQ